MHLQFTDATGARVALRQSPILLKRASSSPKTLNLVLTFLLTVFFAKATGV